jgi:hypothetical protein
LSNIELQQDVDEAAELSDGLQQVFENLAQASGAPVLDAELEKLLHNFMLNAVPGLSLRTVMHREGNVKLMNGNKLTVEQALFDTGALHGNYVSAAFVRRHYDQLKPFLYDCKERVTMADNKTTVNIKQRAYLRVTFFDDEGHEHTAIDTFSVLETCTNDMIIGLPAIARYLGELLKQMIDEAVLCAIPPEDRAAIEKVSQIEVVYPWSQPLDEEAPEDAATPLPCSFTEPLNHLGKAREQSIDEFFDQIKAHVSAAMLEKTAIESLLRTKGINAFIPLDWRGINGIPPLKLTVKPGMPDSIKPRARSVNPKLFENAKKEFDRLLDYFYEKSTSPIASPLVIAPKATNPFIRFCGDYTLINKYIERNHVKIPEVMKELEKIIRFKIFLDFDLTNAFHQIRLHPETSALLSVQTVWGQVQPLFMPEGISPASGVLQQVVSEIFKDFSDWAIVIFDNLLVLATDYDDAYRKAEIIIDRCIERNVVLKFSKTWLGFDHAKFFGYVCREGSYELGQDRKDAIKAIPFPRNLKQMQSFLGAALFFKSFVPNYSALTAPLTDMIRQEFNWDESTWSTDYRKIFEEFKEQLQHAQSIFYPDYTLEWILRTDASIHGVGAVLLQIYRATPDSEPVYQPIGFASQKFSPQACRWSTIEQEAYGVYFGVKYYEYYLRCKAFVLETDHNNLLWMEASAVPKVIRWRVYLQSFTFLLRHIPGKLNVVADWLSRMHAETSPVTPQDRAVTLALMMNDSLDFEAGAALFPDNVNDAQLATVAAAAPERAAVVPEDAAATEASNKVDVVLGKVHGGRMGHHGARETWKLLNKHFPGHRIPYRIVADFVAVCPVCQKDRLGMVDFIEPVVRHLKPSHRRSVIGVDTLSITPADKDGNCILTVIVVHFTKLTALYPGKKHDALTTATALFLFCCSYGMFDSIISDPGSEFMNEVIDHLTRWFSIRHVFSLVDRHESNGVEGTNKMVLRHLKALVMDERVRDRWSSPTVLPLVQFIINSHESSETGVVPFHAHFGSADATYFRMPEEGDGPRSAHAYIQLLDDNLRLLSDISRRFQADLVAKRTAKTPAAAQNIFQPGDLVLWQHNPAEHLPSKLTPKFAGPYAVIEQVKNDVKCKHVIMGNIKEFHVSRLKIFHGTLDQAKEMAMLDHDQYAVSRFIAYRGDPLLRTSMEFEIEFEDGSVVWLPWSKDLFDTMQYEDFCRSRPELTPLLHDAEAAKKQARALNKLPITEVKPGDVVYVDLRSYGAGWYAALPLPDRDHITYLLEYVYREWVPRQQKRKIYCHCALFNETFEVDHVFVKAYGSRFSKPVGNNEVLVDEAMVKEYPALLPTTTTD